MSFSWIPRHVLLLSALGACSSAEPSMAPDADTDAPMAIDDGVADDGVDGAIETSRVLLLEAEPLAVGLVSCVHATLVDGNTGEVLPIPPGSLAIPPSEYVAQVDLSACEAIGRIGDLALIGTAPGTSVIRPFLDGASGVLRVEVRELDGPTLSISGGEVDLGVGAPRFFSVGVEDAAGRGYSNLDPFQVSFEPSDPWLEVYGIDEEDNPSDYALEASAEGTGTLHVRYAPLAIAQAIPVRVHSRSQGTFSGFGDGRIRTRAAVSTDGPCQELIVPGHFVRDPYRYTANVADLADLSVENVSGRAILEGTRVCGRQDGEVIVEASYEGQTLRSSVLIGRVPSVRDLRVVLTDVVREATRICVTHEVSVEVDGSRVNIGNAPSLEIELMPVECGTFPIRNDTGFCAFADSALGFPCDFTNAVYRYALPGAARLVAQAAL